MPRGMHCFTFCCLLLLLLFTLPQARCEDRLSWTDWTNEVKSLTIDSREIAARLQSCVEEALTQEPVSEYHPTYSAVTMELQGRAYRVDVQLNEVSDYVLIIDDTVYPFDRMAGMMILHITELNLGRKTKLSFSVPEDVAALFAGSGYTPAYHIRDLSIKLPKKLECKTSSAVGTYFSYVDPFLRDGGWDLTEYGGQTITAEIYGTYEHCRGALFSSFFLEKEEEGNLPVLFPLRAIVLRKKDRVIGAYLTCDQMPEWMLSVRGETPETVLSGKTVEEVLREHYTMTAADKKAAKMSPEKVIQAWAKAKTRSAANTYVPLDHWLQACVLSARDDQLYVTVADQSYSPLAAKGIRNLRAAPEYDDDNGYHHYDAGFTYISVRDYGPEIGWKVEGSGGF
ncbi:MAG: DUF4830 domain-containing protein [Clostridia bacterium]|nr:DUF4830 domain-containing protein [Clostridia bacterium]